MDGTTVFYRYFIGSLFASLSISAEASVYRCGNTFSQMHCAPDAKEHRIFAGKSGGRRAMNEEHARSCLTNAKQMRPVERGHEFRVLKVSEPKAKLIGFQWKKLMGYEIPDSVESVHRREMVLEDVKCVCDVKQGFERVPKVHVKVRS